MAGVIKLCPNEWHSPTGPEDPWSQSRHPPLWTRPETNGDSSTQSSFLFLLLSQAEQLLISIINVALFP